MSGPSEVDVGVSEGSFRTAIRSVVMVSSSTRGGGERYLVDLYGAAEQLGLRGTLVGQLPGWSLPIEPVTLRGKWNRQMAWRWPYEIPLDWSLMRREILPRSRAVNPDMFHMQYKREQIMATKSASIVAPVLWTEHGPFPRRPLVGPLEAAYRQKSKYVSTIICVSSHVAASIDDVCRGRAPDLAIIENGVDVKKFLPPSADQGASARKRLDLAADRPVAVVASRLVWWKQVELAIEAARIRPELQLLVAGDGPERARLESLAGSNVKMLGQIDNVTDVFHAADCYLHPAKGGFDGLPFSLLEATACGLPPVAIAGTAVGDMAMEAGGFVSENEPQAFADAIDSALSAPRDRPRKWAEDHSLMDSVTSHLKLIRRVLS